MKKTILLLLMALSISCAKQKPEPDWSSMDYNQIEKAGERTLVRFYMWGGSVSINSWIDNYVAPELKKRYGITLIRVPADARVFVNKLLAEKQAGRTTGAIDLVWINGENFKNAMENGLLFGPFTQKLPNYTNYIDPATVDPDFGTPVRNFEAPYGRAQFVFEYDSAIIKDPPMSFAGLSSWVKKHPGRFTYPQPPDFTGSAFIRQAFYAATGGYAQYMKGYDEKLFNDRTKLLWKYLNELKPFLWQKGNTYPRDIAALDTLFERGEAGINMSYHQADAQNRILAGRYPGTVRTFVMKDGSIFNTHYTAIAFNAPNKAGAMITANFLLSPEAQLSKNDPKNWGDFTVLSIRRLPEEWRQRFRKLDLGKATLPLEKLAEHGVPEIPSAYVEKLEDGWAGNVLSR
jgi:putative spermidine/putrescine transport system substrate-binding protein